MNEQSQQQSQQQQSQQQQSQKQQSVNGSNKKIPEPNTHAPLPNQVNDEEENQVNEDNPSFQEFMNEAEQNPYMSRKSEIKTQENEGPDPTERDQSEFTFDSKGDNSFHDSEDEENDSETISTVESAVTVDYEDEHKEEFQMYHKHDSVLIAGEKEHENQVEEIVHFAEDLAVTAMSHTPYHTMPLAKGLFCAIYGLFFAFPLATIIYFGVGAGGGYLIYTYMGWMGRYGLISFCGLWIINYMIGLAGFIARGHVYGQPNLIKKIAYIGFLLLAILLGVLALVGLFLVWWYQRTLVEYMDAYIYSTGILVGVFILLSFYACFAVFCFHPTCLRIHWGVSFLSYFLADFIIAVLSVAACFQGLALGTMGTTVRDQFLYATAIGWGQHIVIDNLIIIISRIFLFSSIGASFALVQK
eukprot:CAMPEP_0117433014 /NCGR_PEP_ID=MMETSP0758-20121206/12434_1 /TAXON_ID=63605 /ORGANISM="Percolomonas cosmopolitus, Strain AE-1 (ATCC 50343)" /LENGTH=413 /DNA_ID=CAMNT_0005223371 /DNA_START=616 /DNA_END=1857 /DNA_ORIENTATION=+